MSPMTNRRAWLSALAAAGTLGLPAAAAAAPRPGVVLGGVTPQSWPVVVELSRNGRQIVRTNIGLDLRCTSGDLFGDSDSFVRLRINKRGRFGLSYGPVTTRNSDGTTTDFAGAIHGSANAARTKLSGTWELTETFYDAAGAVTDTCKSGVVRWKVKQ